jgi:hypothetical protein
MNVRFDELSGLRQFIPGTGVSQSLLSGDEEKSVLRRRQPVADDTTSGSGLFINVVEINFEGWVSRDGRYNSGPVS